MVKYLEIEIEMEIEIEIEIEEYFKVNNNNKI